MPSPRPRIVLIAALTVALLLPARAAFAFGDVSSSYWDYASIKYVASTHDYMSDYGTSFKPTTIEQRKFLARALVKAYRPAEPVDSSIKFTDLPSTDPFYRYANVATKLRWLPKFPDGSWRPTATATVRGLDRALILAMGLSSQVRGLARIHEADGDVYKVGSFFPYIQLAHWLGLHYNHSTESADILSTSLLRRDEMAFTLSHAKQISSWKLSSAWRFSNVTLPSLNPADPTQAAKRKLTEYALNQVGYPYIWGGEWPTRSPSGYCCGYQPQGGFDCSGFVWWVTKKYEGGYNAAQFRSYAGWSLPQRASYQMAGATSTKISYANLKVGNLMFFGSSSGVNHVALYVGNNWMMSSSGSVDGPVLEWVGSGWWRDHFKFGRSLKS
ncbi:MAG TPA: C40 family peptidase [Actinomycetota bacterium]|jgi:cell wall-associated NlpC family hydrolase